MNTARLTIDQSSAPQQVANALRELLLSGEIPPGVKLREVALSEAIGVSRHTLRSGFRILEAEGLVEQRLHRGVIVPELSPVRIADVFRARKALEFAGIHSISLDDPDRQPDVIGALEAAVERMKSATNETELAAADLEYHTAVVDAIGSRIIAEVYRNIQAQLRLTRAWSLRSRGDRALMTETHGAVVSFLRSGHHAEAVQELMAINDVGESRLLAAMAEPKDPDLERPAVWPLDERGDDPKEG